ncbi:hypothetical protein [Allokutzneria albata]|uniref:Secreted protein n=1 Tax=Allokutzneria albata TaxID=211114 RepID=A0A1G9T2D5_ALLAB|nr:hypothetical protein [Allokutzneria albata]SDM41778.1 hypothetical protein SAMN04489726_1518 [Allokutzneria albata]
MRMKRTAVGALAAAGVAMGLISPAAAAVTTDSPVTVQASWHIIKIFPHTEQGKADCLYLAGTYINPPGRCLEGEDGAGNPYWATWIYS